MKHSGKARKAAFKLIILSLIAGAILWALVAFAAIIGTIMSAVALPILIVLWVAFAIFTLYFFRDPEATVPVGANLVVSPAHGKVDVIDKTTEPNFMGGECQRISVFLSVIDVHVQNAPVGGKLAYYKYTVGEFMNAMKTECATCNENLLLGFLPSESRIEKVGIRLIAGVLARRIVPFIAEGDEVARGERISLIQFGSRTDIYLPRHARINVKLGDRVVGGETVIASFD